MARTPKYLWEVEKAPSTLDYAMQYIELGWYIVPTWNVNEDGTCRCGRDNNERGHKPGKHPQANLTPRGHLDASNDPRLIQDWLSTDPDCGLGISLAQSGLIALDIDPQNGGVETLEAIEKEHGVLYSDCIAKTQGGGEHRLFKADANTSYPSSLGEGLDLKHQGYICVAPSVGVSGSYQWFDGKSPISKINPSLPSELPKFISDKSRPHTTSYELVERGGVPVATAQVFDDLRSALKWVDSSDYQTWVNVGLALHPYSENGFATWLEWSKTSPEKFDASVCRKKWDRDLGTAHSITYKSIFRLALDNGWTGPNLKSASSQVLLEGESSSHPLSFDRAVHSGVEKVSTFEYLLDDFISVGVNVLAGPPGIGKTTLAIPLAVSCAHLYPVDYTLAPLIRRNIIIVTESVIQVQRVLYSLFTWGNTGARASDFEERIKVIPSQRLDAEIVCQVAEEYRTWTVPNEMADGGTYDALPLVVFDTANSVFEIENENDNSQVGRVMALVKQSFDGFPVIIIAHTAKALGDGDSGSSLSPRGASAWSGDSHGIYQVFKDGEEADSPRILRATKTRFPTEFNELTFNLVTNCQDHKDILGYDNRVWFQHSIARPLADGERLSAKQRKKDEKQWEAHLQLCEALKNQIRSDPNHAITYYTRMSTARGGVAGSQPRKIKAIEYLKGEGIVEEFELSQAKGSGSAKYGLRVNEQQITNNELDNLEEIPF